MVQATSEPCQDSVRSPDLLKFAKEMFEAWSAASASAIICSAISGSSASTSSTPGMVPAAIGKT